MLAFSRPESARGCQQPRQGLSDLHNVSALLAIALMLAFGVLSVTAQSKIPRYVLLPQLWDRVEVSSLPECEGTPADCAKRFLDASGTNLGNSPVFRSYKLGERAGRNLTIVIVTSKVSDDDSVTGIRYRLAISLGDVEDRTYKLETLARQYTCARGHKSWSKSLCP